MKIPAVPASAGIFPSLLVIAGLSFFFCPLRVVSGMLPDRRGYRRLYLCHSLWHRVPKPRNLDMTSAHPIVRVEPDDPPLTSVREKSGSRHTVHDRNANVRTAAGARPKGFPEVLSLIR